MSVEKPTEKRLSEIGRQRKALLTAGALACTLVCALGLAGCGGQSEASGPPVPYGVVERPTPGGTLVPLPTTGLVSAAEGSATPPPAPTPGPSAVPSPTPPGEQGQASQGASNTPQSAGNAQQGQQSSAGQAASASATPNARNATPAPTATRTATPTTTPTATPTATPTKGG